MDKCCFCCNSLFWVDFEHLFEKIHDNSMDFLVLFTIKAKTTASVFLEHLVVGFSLEYAFSEEKKMEDKT